MTGADGRIQMINPAFQRITGFSEADVVGKTASVFRSRRQGRKFYETLWREVLENDHWQGEIWNRRKDGSVYPEWLTISAVRDKDGVLVNYIGLFTDIAQLKQSQARLDFLAHHDPLTSLPNRLFLRERIERAIASGRSARRSRALLFLDLDRFKTINDSLGHSVGDQLLVLAGERWKRRLRPSDLLARLGGDEFVVLFEPADSPEEATRLAGDLIEAMSEPFVFSDGCEAYVGLSIGITMFPSDEASADELIQRADSALYAAKEGGGGDTVLFAGADAGGARAARHGGGIAARARARRTRAAIPAADHDRRSTRTGRRGAGALALARPA